MPKRGATARNTEGRRILRDLLKTETQKAVADKIGAKQQYVSAWARGLSRPEPQFRDALVREYGEAGFTADSWYTDPEHAIAHGSDDPPAGESGLHAKSDDDDHRAAS